MQSSQYWWVRAYRTIFAVLILVALVVQLPRSAAAYGSAINFLSFFTIQSNIIALAVLLWGAVKPIKEASLSRDLVRGAAVLYLAITGIVYGLLLSGFQDQLQISLPWVNTVFHQLMPLVMIIDWLIDSPSKLLSFQKALIWVAYPLVWLVLTMIRGVFVEWYPYPFLDPAQPGGYGAVLLYVLGILIGALLLISLIVLIGRKVRLFK